MNASPDHARAALTDSPWFWLMLFSAAGLFALLVLDQKYGPRQAQLERQYQAKQWSHFKSDPASGDPAETVRYSTESDTLIGLWPIRAIAVAIFVASAVALIVSRRRAKVPPGQASSPSPPGAA